MRRTFSVSVIAVALVWVLACAPAPAMASGITNSGDDGRTGWYPNAQISPQVVTGGTFGQLWSANVVGQVYAQPQVATNSDGSPESVIVTTEQDNVYALNPTTGAQQWSTNMGAPWNPSDVGCGDIQPYRGSTSTPVIDPSTNTVYLTYKTYSGSGAADWFMAALNIKTGAEQAGFPVELNGNADNFSSLSFDPQTQDQRPGLLLMNGVIYAAFGGICDTQPWQGWVFGVATSTGQVTTRWADNPIGDGAGIWQSGVGLTSDGPGTLLFVTGNGGSPTVPASASSMPNSFGESVVRLNVGADGQLAPADFFAPFDASELDLWDADFGSGAVVALPPAEFGTPSLPDLGVVVGKEGYVYLLNLQNLGGFEQASGGGDDVVQRLGPFGGVWGRAGVWPGDGGYLYIPTSTGLSKGGLLDAYQYGLTGTGAPSLAADGSASTTFGWGSGSPVITSAGTTSGSALVWVIWSADRTGAGAQLRAYDPIPVNGTLQQVYSASIGTSTNYSMPGVGNNGDLYVGTRRNTVLAFGSPVTEPVNGPSLSFAATQTGATSAPQTLTLTVYSPVQISAITSSSSQFTVGAPSSTLPGTFGTGDTISIPVAFSPTQIGPVGGNITVATNSGTISIPVSGTGESSSPDLVAEQAGLSLGGTTVGNTLSGTVTFANAGNAPLTITNVDTPSAPFSAVGAPTTPYVLNANQSVTIEIDFTPTVTGQFSDAIGLESTAGDVSVGISGSAATPPALQVTSETNDFGNVDIGSTATATFTLTNTGGSVLTINKSKPPFGGEFTAVSSLQEGTTIAPGDTLTETVEFAPTASGPASGVWSITADDASGLQQVEFTGDGEAPPGPTTTSTTATSTHTTTTPAHGATAPAHTKPRAPTIWPSATIDAANRRSYITYTAVLRRPSRFTLERQSVGRRSGGRCVPATGRNSHLATCTRWVTVKVFTHADTLGVDKIWLVDLMPGNRLVRGTYRLRSALDDSNGHPRSFITRFKIT
jgi:iron transport multicopper oxidase